jgi:hypothetical protein
MTAISSPDNEVLFFDNLPRGKRLDWPSLTMGERNR